jgi:hypothetical protein
MPRSHLKAPEEADPRGEEPVIEAGRKVFVVGFGDGGMVQVVPVEWSPRLQELDSTG